MGWFDGLPRGWKAARDGSGRAYFYSQTGQVQWERPVATSKGLPPYAIVGSVIVVCSVAAVAVIHPGTAVAQHVQDASAAHAVRWSATTRQPPKKPEFNTWEDGRADLLSEPFWRKLGSGLGLSVSERMQEERVAHALDGTALRASMRRDGYVHLPLVVSDTSQLSSIIDELEGVGMPAQFMLLFDEVWEVVNRVSSSLEPVFGLSNIQDFFVFNVPPGGAGWPMHRDRSGADLASSGFSSEALPLSTTVWIGLTDANVQSSCIFCLPAHADPNYLAETVAEDASTILARGHQHVRPMPVAKGDVLAWSFRLLHWGSASPVDAPAARKTLTFTMADPRFERPSIVTSSAQLPSFAARLALISYSLVCYHHSEPVPPHVVHVLLEVLRRPHFLRHLTADALSASCGGQGFEHNLALAAATIAGGRVGAALPTEEDASSSSLATSLRVISGNIELVLLEKVG